ncbi:MAG: hypothetical protein Q8R37_05765 [Nanoarchaeota archaeon]|nr:hypothetical protein [Nanoarchaeota archaeon]
MKAVVEVENTIAAEVRTLDSLLQEFERQRLNLVYEIVDYPSETITCREKFVLWEEHKITEKIRSSHPEYRFDIAKSLLVQFQKGNQNQYILACTLSSKKVDFNELRVEFGLSREEAESLAYKNIDEADLLSITGSRRGEITPLLAEEKLDNLEGVYFTRDLMIDAMNNPTKLYDFPLTLQRSLFVNAATVFYFLQRRNSKYTTSSDLQGGAPFEVIQWKVKKVTNAGYPYIFTGSEVSFRGQEYLIKNPRQDHGCIALPFSRTKQGAKVFENHGSKTQRVLLPINYGVVLKSYLHTHLDAWIENRI